MDNNSTKELVVKIFKKDKFATAFFILAILSLILSTFNYFQFSPYFNTLNSLINLFPYWIFIFLGLMFIVSGILAYNKKYSWMFVPILIWLLFMTFTIRTSNVGDLVNAATGEPVLGPDLDPYLFMRLAEDIVGDGLKNPDMMRGYPHGVPNYAYTNSEAWKIATIYWIVNIFNPNFTIIQAGIYSTPVWFTLSIIPLFLLLFFLFSFTLDKKMSMVGATIGSFFYAMAPVILPRSVAGIPESEGHAFIWLFMALLFFVLAWKQEDWKKISLFAILSGIFTTVMAWTWGGFSYIFMIVALTSGFLFLIEKDKTKNLIIMAFFVGVSFVLILPRYLLSDQRLFSGILDLTTSLTDTGLAFAVFGILLVDYLIFRTTINKKIKKYLAKIKLPENIVSIIVSVLIGLVALLIVKPSFLIELIPKIIETLISPFGAGRFGETVAEHRLPYFNEVINSFGYLFWIFFFATIYVFYEATKHFKIKEKIILNFSFLIFITTFMFSRIGPQHFLDGVSFISKTLYFGGMIFFGITLIYVYSKAYKNNDEKTIEDFKKISFNYLFIISTSFIALFSLRVAIRFFLMASILMLPAVSYFPLILFRNAKKTKDEMMKIFFWAIFLITILLLFSIGLSHAIQIQATAKAMIPSPYNQQWHKAMHWVTENTPEDAVFSHWWDYGYWVQTLGKRATIADGGHWAGPPAHFLGRYVLTTPKPETALSMLKTFGATHLLIDSTEVGKYSAFSSIGSDETGKDRLSWIPVMDSDKRQIQETSQGILRIYQGGSVLDADIVYEDGNGTTFLPGERAGILGIFLTTSKRMEGNDTLISFEQPIGVFVYNNQRKELPIRYLYYNGQIIDYGTGINSTIVLLDKLEQTGQGVLIDNYGALIYLSEKTMNSLFAQLYLMNDPFNRYPTINLVHSEDDSVVNFAKMAGLSKQDMLYYHGFRGPIKIWEIEYGENVKVHPELLERHNFDGKDKFGRLDYLWE